MDKNTILKQIINLFFNIEGIRVDKIWELSKAAKIRLRGELTHAVKVVSSLRYLLQLSMPSDKRFIRLLVPECKAKYLTKPFLIEDWKYKDFPFLLANKKFLEALYWLNGILVENGYTMKIIRGFLPYIRSSNFSWEHRLLVAHGNGKAADIIIANKTVEESFKILQAIVPSLALSPFPLIFVKLPDSIHVGFGSWRLRARFFEAGAYRNKLCSNFIANPVFRLMV